jgi:protein HOOK3
MNNETLESSILKWVNTFELKNPVKTIEELYDGVVFNEILNDINPVWFKAIQTNEGESDGNWVVIFNRLKKIYSLLSGYYAEELGQSVVEIESPNFNLISKNKDKREIVKFAQLILVLAVQSEKNREYIQKITSLNQANQQWIMISIEEIMDKLSKVNDPNEGIINEPSQNEVTIRLLKAERDELYEKKKELSNKLESVQRENIRINEQKRILEDRIRDFEDQMEDVNKLGKTDLILKSEISSLKNQLDLSEDKCQEMELLNEQKQKTIDALEKRIVEISKQAEEAGILKDKMDEFDHMKNRLNATEETAARYKRKLEDNQLLLKQFEDLQKESREQSEKNQVLEEENAKYNDLKQLAKEYKEKIVNLEARNNELIEELKNIQNEINENEEKIRTLEERNAESVDLIEELQEKLNNLELTNETGDINFQSQNNDSKEYELKLKIADLEEQLKSKNPTELEARIKDITELKEKFENDYMAVYKENLKLKGELNQNVNTDGGLSSDSKKVINSYIEEINRLTNKLSNYENAIEIERAGGDITTSRAFFELQKDNKVLNNKIKETIAENSSQKDEIAKLKQEIERLKASETDLKKQNENQKSINKNLNDTLASLNSGELSDMGVKLAKISSKYYVSNEKINELQRTLAVARNYITTLDEKINKQKIKENKQIEKYEHEILVLEKELNSQRAIYERELSLMSFAWYRMSIRATQTNIDMSRNNERTSFLGQERKNLENRYLGFK